MQVLRPAVLRFDTSALFSPVVLVALLVVLLAGDDI
jgi:hypothetical protein